VIILDKELQIASIGDSPRSRDGEWSNTQILHLSMESKVFAPALEAIRICLQTMLLRPLEFLITLCIDINLDQDGDRQHSFLCGLVREANHHRHESTTFINTHEMIVERGNVLIVEKDFLSSGANIIKQGFDREIGFCSNNPTVTLPRIFFDDNILARHGVRLERSSVRYWFDMTIVKIVRHNPCQAISIVFVIQKQVGWRLLSVTTGPNFCAR